MYKFFFSIKSNKLKNASLAASRIKLLHAQRTKISIPIPDIIKNAFKTTEENEDKCSINW